MLKDVLLVVDVETGGLDPNQYCVIEIAAAILEIYNGRLDMPTDSLYHSKVKPDRPVNDGAAEVNHYTINDWANAPELAQGLKEFFVWIRRKCLNYEGIIAPMWTGCNPYFDLMFIKSDARRHHISLPEGLHYRIMDVQSMCLPLVWLDEIPGVGLSHLRSWAGCVGEQYHTALEDVMDTCIVINKMFEVIKYV